MRDIRFRAWDKRLKMWCYDFPNLGGFTLFGEVLLIDGFSSHFGENPAQDGNGNRLNSLDRLDDIEFTQFTGLHDKHGKEIYEGDILKYSDGSDVSHHRIFWDDKAARWMDKRLEDGDSSTAYDGFEFVRDCQIIGNIYQNPELVSPSKPITNGD